MKKVLALLLAVVMVIGMTTMAMAEGETTTVNIPVNYTLVGEGTSPAETFTLDTTPANVTKEELTHALTVGQTIPDLEEITGAAFTDTDGAVANPGNKKNIVVTLPNPTEFPAPGRYQYTLKQLAGTNAGVKYDNADVVIRVTVSNEGGTMHFESIVATVGGKKVDSGDGKLENTYSAGKLNVGKIVTGNLGDRSKYFDITVTLNAEAVAEGQTAKTYQSITVNKLSGTGDNLNPTSVAIPSTTTFHIHDGETIAFNNVPYGVTYTVSEANYTGEGYDAAVYSPATINTKAETVGSAAENVTITNNKEQNVDTGIVLDSLPYILIGVAVAAAAVLMVAKKRRIED